MTARPGLFAGHSGDMAVACASVRECRLSEGLIGSSYTAWLRGSADSLTRRRTHAVSTDMTAGCASVQE
jgi:hypothetical protein